jgi:hypothetical protein
VTYSHTKRVYIFRSNNQLIISENGIVEKGIWEYLGNQTLLVETKEESLMFKHGFIDDTIIALKLDNSNNYAFFINETKINQELNNIKDILKFLNDKYLKSNVEKETKKTFILDSEISYEIINETNDFDLFWGRYSTLQIRFSNGEIDKIYKGKFSGKFFYFDLVFGKIYCENMADTVNKLFFNNKKK